MYDFAVYHKYIYNYKSVKKFKNHTKFKKVTEKDIENIKGYFENFEGWLAEDPFMTTEQYGFKWSQIKVDDYYYIYGDEETTINEIGYEKYG